MIVIYGEQDAIGKTLGPALAESPALPRIVVVLTPWEAGGILARQPSTIQELQDRIITVMRGGI